MESDAVRIQFFRNKHVGSWGAANKDVYGLHARIHSCLYSARSCAVLRFSPKIGGLDAVLTAVVEVAEKITPEELLAAARREPERSQVQRLGWLLDHAERRDLSEPLARWLAKKRPTKVVLDISRSVRGFAKDPRWQVIVNAEPQVQL